MKRELAGLGLSAMLGWGAVLCVGVSVTPAQTTSMSYNHAMEIGYAATAQQDYQTALINFRRALAARPGDRYAIAAIANVQSYIQRQREIAARRQEIADLQARIRTSVEARDWICATTSLDRLITLVPANSPEQVRLIAYRGELSGFLDARTDVGVWGTICGGI
jgi:tetratricopeptide (TPR) repeat protein